MNAPTDKALLSIQDGTYELIPIGAIAPSDTHIQKLRRARYNMESLADLRASVGKLGVQQPGVVRKLKALRGLASYELVAGERRFKAAGVAGLAHFPAIVRDLTDEQVLEIQLVENLQREDLHPLEEAAGYEELMKVGNLKKEDLGEKVGKSRSWVYSRLNLLKLPTDAQKALQDGRIDVSRALIVASVVQPEQRSKVMEMAIMRNEDNNYRYSVRQLRAEILKDRLTFPLVGAPFPTDDAGLLPAAGNCGGCQYRSGNCDPEASDPDVCMNVPCYHKKVDAQAARRREQALAAGAKVLKGEEARKISPSVKTVYGHVDLDLVCEHDDFPEEQPDVDYEEEATHPKMLAWRAKEEAWQPRTYRALLAGEKYQSVLIDDPKTKQLRELVPFKVAQALLRKKGVELPSYANKERPSHHGKGRSTAASSKKEDPAKKAAEEQKRLLEERIANATVARILEQVKAKHSGALGVEELIYLADGTLSDISEDASEMLWKAFGYKHPDWRAREKAMEKIPSKDLQRFIVAGMVCNGLTDSFGRIEKITGRILGQLKIDRKKIEADVRKTLTPAAATPAKPTPKGKK